MRVKAAKCHEEPEFNSRSQLSLCNPGRGGYEVQDDEKSLFPLALKDARVHERRKHFVMLRKSSFKKLPR